VGIDSSSQAQLLTNGESVMCAAPLWSRSSEPVHVTDSLALLWVHVTLERSFAGACLSSSSGRVPRRSSHISSKALAWRQSTPLLASCAIGLALSMLKQSSVSCRCLHQQLWQQGTQQKQLKSHKSPGAAFEGFPCCWTHKYKLVSSMPEQSSGSCRCMHQQQWQQETLQKQLRHRQSPGLALS